MNTNTFNVAISPKTFSLTDENPCTFPLISTFCHAQVERNRALLLKGVVVIQTAVRVSTAGDLAERLRPAGTTVEDDTTGSEYLRTQQNILTQLKRLAMYRTGEAQSQTLGLQWALLAMICDRMFFYVLLMVGTIGVGTIVLRFILMV